MSDTKITMLNSMSGVDFLATMNKHVEWGVKIVDLKDSIFGKSLIDLIDEEARKAKDIIDKRKLSVSCLSSTLFCDDMEKGEEYFRKNHLNKVDRLIELSNIFKPYLVRLLSARSNRRKEFNNIIEYINKNHSWLISMYREAVDKIYKAGFNVGIENEVDNNIFSNPEEIKDFFKVLDRKQKAFFIYDVQNLWQQGTFPTISVYNELRNLIIAFHLKGGIVGEDGKTLKWASSLEDASWSVVEITRQAVKDGIKVICLNFSHGQTKPGYNYNNVTERDLNFVKKIILEVD